MERDEENRNVISEQPVYDLEHLMREYGNDVLRTAYLYLNDRDTAEDIFQQVFLKVYQKIGDFRGESSVKTWLIRITINACKDYIKSAWNRNTTGMSEETENTVAAKDCYEEVDAALDAVPVKDAVMHLPNKFKEVILCVFYQELSIKETAAMLSIPEGTVKSRLARAKESLRDTLERRNTR